MIQLLIVGLYHIDVKIEAHFLLIPIINQLAYLTGAKYVFTQLAMHSLKIRPRMPETEPKWFMFGTSS